jgi:hypothetical protein
MGQFSTRPEEPTEWAGLPSEPDRGRSQAESLEPPIESAASLAFLGAVESVVVPLTPVDSASTETEPADSETPGTEPPAARTAE